MNDILWVVQENLGHSSDVDLLRSAAESRGLSYLPVRIAPFSDAIPNIDWRGPVIAYGSTRFITNVQRAKRWRPGAYFDEPAFSMATVLDRYQQDALNFQADQTTIERFAEHGYADDATVFVRPVRDLKQFEAQVIVAGELSAWFAKICQGDFELRPDTPILVARPRQIEREWRVFIVDRQYCSGSRYRTLGELDVDSSVPMEVIGFAEQMTRRWSPAKTFVLDVAMVEGELKVVETNCFNSSGFYASDVKAIVAAVSRSI